MKELLIVFAKNLIKGKVKTRLAFGIGDDGALKVYQELLRHTFTISRSLPCRKVIYYSDFIPSDSQWKTAGFLEAIQNGDDLGSRMMNAFKTAFAEGFKKVVIIGTDCIELTTAGIQIAFQRLDEKDVVIGPAQDGGYYLLGVKQLHPNLFLNKSWSTAQVFNETLNDCRKQNLSCSVLEELSDIDTPEDLMSSPLFQQKLSAS